MSVEHERSHRQIADDLLDAAWRRVGYYGPVERHRSRGPFDPGSIRGALGLAYMDLVVLERAAFEHVLYEHGITFVEDDRPRPAHLEETGADAASTLISLAVDLAQAINEPEYTTREGLDPLIREAVARGLGQLLDERPPYSYLAAAESVGRITDHAIGHGVKTFGPIVILAPAADAIAGVIARTVANISPWDWGEDEDDDLEHELRDPSIQDDEDDEDELD